MKSYGQASIADVIWADWQASVWELYVHTSRRLCGYFYRQVGKRLYVQSMGQSRRRLYVHSVGQAWRPLYVVYGAV
jgi:hypothetical protein